MKAIDDPDAEIARLNRVAQDANFELNALRARTIQTRKAVEAIVDECGCGKCRVRTDQVIEALRGPVAHPDDVKATRTVKAFGYDIEIETGDTSAN